MKMFIAKVKTFLALVKAFLSTPQFNTARATLQVTASGILTTLVAQGKIPADEAAQLGALAAAVLSPALASIFAPDGWRTWLFRILAPVQGVLVYFGGENNLWVILAGSVATSWLSTGFATANVHRANGPQ